MNSDDIEHYYDDPDVLLKKHFLDPKYCMAYDKHNCDGAIVSTHPISKKYLEFIAKNGQVYTPVGTIKQKKHLYKFKLKDIEQATHMNGFCEFHDKALFSLFEHVDFHGQYAQIYAISFKALAHEYFQKKCLHSFFEKLKSGLLKSYDNNYYTNSDRFKESHAVAVKAANDRKFIYEQLEKYKTAGLSYLLIETSLLPISMTGVLFTMYAPDGSKFQKDNKKQLGFIYNIISLRDRSFIIMATVKSLHNNVHEKLLKSIHALENKGKLNYFLTSGFFNHENIAVSPEWYEGLSDKSRGQLDKLMNYHHELPDEAAAEEFIDFAELIPAHVISSKLVL